MEIIGGALQIFARKTGRYVGSAVEDAFDGIEELLANGRLQDIARASGLEGGLDVRMFSVHRDEYQFHSGQALLHLECGIDAVQQWRAITG